MNRYLLVLTAWFALNLQSDAMAQVDPLDSGVFRWNAGNGERILLGSTTDLAFLEVNVVTIPAGAASAKAIRHADLEMMAIVMSGKLRVELGEERAVLGPGSVVLVLPGDAYTFANTGDEPATYYRFTYRGKKPMDPARGREAGGSLMVDWEEVEWQPGEKGGRRQIFDRATAVFERFEMHATTLNEGLTSHDPHQHRAEEFILVLQSDVEEFIDPNRYPASVGDLLYLASQSLHTITSTGTGSSEYLAFQWQ